MISNQLSDDRERCRPTESLNENKQGSDVGSPQRWRHCPRLSHRLQPLHMRHNQAAKINTIPQTENSSTPPEGEGKKAERMKNGGGGEGRNNEQLRGGGEGRRWVLINYEPSGSKLSPLKFMLYLRTARDRDTSKVSADLTDSLSVVLHKTTEVSECSPPTTESY